MAPRQLLDIDGGRRPVSRRALLLGLAAAPAVLAGCGGSESALLTAAGVSRVPPAADAPVADSVAAMTTLAARLLASSTAGPNWIASPLSMACAFAMARVGAAGDTAAQLDKVFGFPAHGRDDSFNAITRELGVTDQPPAKLAERKPDAPPPAPVVSLGNALFTAAGLRIGEPFLRVLAAQYGTGARPVDFTSATAAHQINAWVSRQTAGRITKLFDQLDTSTKLVLANAVYFKGYWATELHPGAAAPGFTRADGRRVDAPMMSRVLSVPYASVRGVQAVELPYAGGTYAMRIILPPPGGRPADVLSAPTVAAVAGALATSPVTVSLPRFALKTDLDLGDLLGRLGLTAPFGQTADFSGIAPRLFVSQAVHRATITVDEWGTEAAAVTGMAMATSAMAPPPLTFAANRPFAFQIVGGPHRVPLFVGQVGDPTAG